MRLFTDLVKPSVFRGEKREFIAFLQQSRIDGVDNPYDDFGYELMFEEIDTSYKGWQQVNGVKFFITDIEFKVVAPRSALVTLVDILFFSIKLVSFECNNINSCDEVNMLKELAFKNLDHYEMILSSTDKNAYLEMRYTLIYKITSEYEDPYFRELALVARRD